MFKNLIVYRIDPAWRCSLQDLEHALQAAPFLPCAATQAESAGWVPPRGQAHGALVESVGGQWILRYQQESRLLPASVVQHDRQGVIQSGVRRRAALHERD